MFLDESYVKFLKYKINLYKFLIFYQISIRIKIIFIYLKLNLKKLNKLKI